MYAQFHVNWDVQRESARNCAYTRIDTSRFICAQQLSRFWRPQSFSKKSTQVLVHEAPALYPCSVAGGGLGVCPSSLHVFRGPGEGFRTVSLGGSSGEY